MSLKKVVTINLYKKFQAGSKEKEFKKRQLIKKSIELYRQKPDFFVEEVLEIPLNVYQKVALRAFFKYKYFILCWSRGLAKTWTGALAIVTYAMLYPNQKIGVIAPSFRQSKMVIEEKIIRDLMERSKFLTEEIGVNWTVSTAEAKVEFENGSYIRAVPMGDGNKLRGYRFDVLFVDEYAQCKKEILDLVINPMMNVKSNYEVGKKDDEYITENKALFTSTPYFKFNHFYKTFLLYCNEILRGNNKYFVSVLDYTVGLKVGLFDSDHIEKEKRRLSPLDFAMEYGATFVSLSENAWINPKDLIECSDMKEIETKGNKKYKYIMGVDVARSKGNDNTSIQIIKLVEKNNVFERHNIYSETLNGAKFSIQNEHVRLAMERYNVTDLYIDSTGLGVGLLDELAKPFEYGGKTYPPLIDINNPVAIEENEAQGLGGILCIHGIKMNAEINHKLGMSMKRATQKHLLKFYSNESVDEILDGEADKTLEYENFILEAEQTRREIMRIEAKPNGLYYKFDVPHRGRGIEGRKDRWTAISLCNYGADIYEDEYFKKDEDDDLLIGCVSIRDF